MLDAANKLHPNIQCAQTLPMPECGRADVDKRSVSVGNVLFVWCMCLCMILLMFNSPHLACFV